MKLGDKIQSADWKSEKHVPVIECADEVDAGKPFEVMVSVGKEIPHPNTQEHFIKWIAVYFQPQGNKFVYQVGHFEFAAHGEAEIFTSPVAKCALQVNGPGTLMALSLCNIHGLWESAKEIKVS
jgi:superoxide reductase